MSKPDESESFAEQLERISLMADGDPTWDLSENDQSALRAVILHIEELKAERERWKMELKSLIVKSGAEISEPSEEPGVLGKEYLAWCIRQVSVYFQAELKPLRELAEMQKRHHAEQSHPYQVPFEKCIDPMCLKAREAEEAMKYG